MVDIFISYKYEDQGFAYDIFGHLRDQGFNVWLDTLTPPGVQWKEERFRALQEAQALIVLLSPEALDSRYIRQEWNYFVVQQKNIIPILLRDIHFGDIPPELAEYVYIDTRNPEVSGSILLERIEWALDNILAEKDSFTLRFQNEVMLTPNYLSDVVMPYVHAVSNLQRLMDEMQGRDTGVHRVPRISNPILSIEFSANIAPVIEALRGIFDPLSRDSQRAKTDRERAETRGIELDNVRKEIQTVRELNQLIEDTHPDGLNITLEVREYYFAQMHPHYKTVRESPLIPASSDLAAGKRPKRPNPSPLPPGFRRVE